MNTIFAIGNTHFDPVWLWTWDEAMAGIRSTFASALARMTENPDFTYSFCCPPVFEWIREVDPAMFESIRARVAEGRWELSEGWYLQPDCNAGLGESYVRHGLYGQNYLLATFGKRAVTVFNSDSFGHPSSLPQILHKCGIRYYAFSRPDPTEQELPGPLFRWQSSDGSQVLAYRIQEGHAPDIQTSIQFFSEAIGSSPHDLMLVYGITNHGGAPTKKAIAQLASLSADATLPYHVRFGGTEDFFSAQTADALPIVTDDLITRNFGVFINNHSVKQHGRQGEYMLLQAERAAWMASSQGKEYPLAPLTKSWEDILFSQFHDIIGGACIPQAYFHARNLQGRALVTGEEILHKSLQYLTKDMQMLSSLWNLVVFNLHAAPYSGPIEAEVQWVWELDWYSGALEVFDEAGRTYPCQIIKERSNIPAFRSRIAFHADLPSLGYKVFGLRQIQGDPTPRPDPTSNSISCGCSSISINPETGAASYRDERFQLSSLLTPLALSDAGDTWAFNVDGYEAALEDFHFVSSHVLEQGDILSRIQVSYTFRNSLLELTYSLYANQPYMDCHFRVNWNESQTALKFCLPPCDDPAFLVGLPYGQSSRSFDGREYPLNEWLTTSHYMVVSESVFAYDTDAENQTVRLSILRSPIAGDLRMGDLDPNQRYDYTDQGITEGDIRLYMGTWHSGPAAAAAEAMPPIVVDEAFHEGSRGAEESWLRLEGDAALVSAVKMAEDGSSDLILRLWETRGADASLTVAPKDCASASITLSPFEIKTLRFSGDTVRETSMLEL